MITAGIQESSLIVPEDSIFTFEFEFEVQALLGIGAADVSVLKKITHRKRYDRLY